MKWILGDNVNINDIHATAVLLPEKARILEYFQNHTSNAAYASSTVIDVTTHTDTRIPEALYNDGEYRWSATLVYLFKKYNLKLNDDFIQHVLSKS